MTFREEIYEFEYFVRMVASVLIEHRSAGGRARKYKLAHVSTLLSYLSNVIMRIIQLALVIIEVQFLQRWIYVELLYTNFSVGAIHTTKLNAAKVL